MKYKTAGMCKHDGCDNPADPSYRTLYPKDDGYGQVLAISTRKTYSVPGKTPGVHQHSCPYIETKRLALFVDQGAQTSTLGVVTGKGEINTPTQELDVRCC